jgi:hypothetical protein
MVFVRDAQVVPVRLILTSTSCPMVQHCGSISETIPMNDQRRPCSSITVSDTSRTLCSRKRCRKCLRNPHCLIYGHGMRRRWSRCSSTVWRNVPSIEGAKDGARNPTPIHRRGERGGDFTEPTGFGQGIHCSRYCKNHNVIAKYLVVLHDSKTRLDWASTPVAARSAIPTRFRVPNRFNDFHLCTHGFLAPLQCASPWGIKCHYTGETK